MSLELRWSCMSAATMQYDLVRVMSEWQKSAFAPASRPVVTTS
jgi:hypothetical protein